jgi:hypothetical protein
MPDKIDNQDPGNGTDPTKTSNPAKPNVTEPTPAKKPFDETVFDDPELWKHPRFKSLNERAKRADELEKAQSEADEKRLAEAKKFEELATKVAQERDTIKSKLTSSIQDNRIITEATKIGVVDVEAVLKLVDRSNVRIDDNGNVTGALEAVTALVSSKPYLKVGQGNRPIGSATNPGADDQAGLKRFKLSQIQNPVFYKENEADILKAYAAGLIENDRQ